MKKYWVYIHTCPNGKKYVGCTTQVKPEYRWREGNGYQYNKHFYSAILKHGWDNFQHEVFEVDSAEEMYRKEVELISFYHSNDPKYGYNNSVGGEKGASGCTRSEEFRKRVSEAVKERCSDPEFRKKLSEAKKGKPCSEATRKKISQANKGKTLSKETKKKIAESREGKLHSEESRKKMSEAQKEVQKKVHLDPEYRKKISKANKGKTRSEESKKHLSEACKNKPKVKIKLPDGTIVETTKNIIVRWYVNRGKKFEYVS